MEQRHIHAKDDMIPTQKQFLQEVINGMQQQEQKKRDDQIAVQQKEVDTVKTKHKR